jgi:HEAT repeat protein
MAVIAALGRIRDRRATGALIACLKDADDQVRIGAAEVLGKLGDPRALQPLGALGGDLFSGVRDAAEDAAGRIRKKNGPSR